MKKIDKAYLLLNGNKPKASSTMHNIMQADYVVCADGAYNWAKYICKPDIIVGDMDSVQNLPQDIPVLTSPKDKDYTDGQLAMQHILQLNASNIIIAGSRGGRPDHEWYNYMLLLQGSNISIEDDDYFVQLVRDILVKDIGVGKIVSLSPFLSTVHILYTKGLLYPIEAQAFDGLGLAPISNVTIHDIFEIAVQQGTALVFYQKGEL